MNEEGSKYLYSGEYNIPAITHDATSIILRENNSTIGLFLAVIDAPTGKKILEDTFNSTIDMSGLSESHQKKEQESEPGTTPNNGVNL